MSSSPFTGSSYALAGLSDAEIVEGIKAGKPRFQSELYARYAGKIYYKCLGMLKNSDQAQDLAHDIFIKISTNLEKFKGTSELSFWIYAITYNHCISYLKKEKRLRFEAIDDKVDAEDESEHELTEKIVRDLKLTQLKRLIKQLKPDEEVILLMRYQEGMSIRQIATILNIGESAVKMRLARVRNRLAELFNDFDQ